MASVEMYELHILITRLLTRESKSQWSQRGHDRFFMFTYRLHLVVHANVTKCQLTTQ